MYIVSNVSVSETVSRRVLERLGLVTLTSRSRLGLETQTYRDLASPETSSTSRETFKKHVLAALSLPVHITGVAGCIVKRNPCWVLITCDIAESQFE